MNNSLRLFKDSEQTERPALTESLKSVFFQYFEQLVDSCCVRIDSEFGLQLAKGHEYVARDQYKSLVESLRSVRDEIKRNYLLALNESFDLLNQKKTGRHEGVINLSEVLLASDDFVKEDYTTNLIIRHNQQKYHEIISRLNVQLAQLFQKSTISPSQNPVTPENLVKTLITVVKPLKLYSKQRVALYKIFDDNVFNQMGFIYHELIKQCESLQLAIASSLPEPIKTPFLPNNPMSEEFRLLQQQLSLWRSHQALSDYNCIDTESPNCYEHFEIANALQVLRQFHQSEPSTYQPVHHSLKHAVLKKLEELNFSNDSKTLAKIDEDVLDLVSILFSEVANHPHLSAKVKSILLELAAPMSAVCLGQYGIFSLSDHPVRFLFNSLVDFYRFFSHDTKAERIALKQLSVLVNKLNEASGFTLQGWVDAAKQWHVFAEQRQQQKQSSESAAIQNMIDFDNRFEFEQIAITAIESSVQNRKLPETIRDFLMTVWKDAMIYTYASKDSQPELWQKSVQTMNELIDSLTPPLDSTERVQRLKLMPDMIKDLRNGLNSIACDKDWQSRFFKELAVLHVLTMNQKSAVATTATQAQSATNNQANHSNDIYDDQARNLVIGDWLAFHLDNDDEKWLKLAYKCSNSRYLLFVNKLGEAIVRLKDQELAEQLRLGETTAINPEHAPIIDAVASKLYALNQLSSP